MRCPPILAPLLSLGLLLACGGGGNVTGSVIPKGSLALRFGSDSLPGYDQAVVSLEKVEGTTDGTNWSLLASVKTTFDLRALQNGNSAVILQASPVAAGSYAQFRLTWATVNYQSSILLPAYVFPSSASLGQPLTMPTTTVVAGPVVVPVNGSTVAQLMLSGQEAVQSRAGGTYTFQATGHAYDLAVSARITGHLGNGLTPISGVEVYAQTVDGTGLATLQRRAFSDASGNYVLEGLATGSLYFVAAQPGGTSPYAAVASAPVDATTATTYTADMTFTGQVASGALTLTITPASTATQGTWGELRQTLRPIGSATDQVLIVRAQPVATGLTQDQATFTGLAPGSYGVVAQRSTAGAAPVMKKGTTVAVSAGATATPALSYP